MAKNNKSAAKSNMTSDIDADSKDVWNLSDILGGKTPDQLIEQVKAKAESFKKCKSKLNKDLSIKEFLEIVKLKEEIKVLSNKVANFYTLKFYEDSSDSVALSKMTYITQLLTDMGNELLFFSLWFMHLDEKQAKKYIDAKELEKYKYHLEEIRKLLPYTKSEEIEQILNLKSVTSTEALITVYDVLTGHFMFDFEGKKLSQAEVSAFAKSKDPRLRQKAYESLLGKYIENGTVLTELYKSIVIDWYNEGIKIRKYPSPITVWNINNDIEDKAVTALLNVVRKNASIFTEYFKLRYELNKKNGEKYPYSRVHLYAPYDTKIEDDYSYEYCKNYSLETFKKFDERFYTAALEIFEKKHVHSHPQKNKRSGAFCECISTDIPPYLMLNHTNKFKDMYTIMHEVGHGIHYIFSRVQSNFTYHASLPMAETASVFSEMLLSERLLKESKNNNIKTQILIDQLDNQYATITRQAYFVIFELYAHEKIKEGATKEQLEDYYYSLLKEQFKDMEIPDIFRNEWNYIPHIHETPFYCYAYAWGNLMVLALYDMYRKEGKKFVEKYIKLLSYGGGKAPKDILAELGIDPADEKFWQRGFDIIKEEIAELKRVAK